MGGIDSRGRLQGGSNDSVCRRGKVNPADKRCDWQQNWNSHSGSRIKLSCLLSEVFKRGVKSIQRENIAVGILA